MRRDNNGPAGRNSALALFHALPVPACMLAPAAPPDAGSIVAPAIHLTTQFRDPADTALVIEAGILPGTFIPGSIIHANIPLQALLGMDEPFPTGTCLDDLTVGYAALGTLTKHWDKDLFAREFNNSTSEAPPLAGGDSGSVLRGLRHTDGHTVWVAEQVSPYTLDDGLTVQLMILTDMSERKRVEDGLIQRLGMVRNMFERLPAPMFVKDAEGCFVEANTAYLAYSGIDRSQVVGRTTAALLSRQAASHHMRVDRKLIESGGQLNYEEAVRFANEQTRLVCISKAGFDVDGERGVIGVVHDLIEGMPSEARLRAILEQSPIGVSVSRREDGRIIFANSRFAQLVGEQQERLIGRYARDYYLDAEQRDRVVERLRENKAVVNMEIQFRRADGSPFWTLFTVNQAVIGGVPVNLAWVYDYTDRWHMQEALRDMASRDPLTGIYNRRSFLDLARQHLARASRTAEPVTLMLLDVDHFKTVNDTWGHAVGDDALRLVADGCHSTLREYDLLGRFGGEEFIILLPGTPLAEGAAVAERIRRHISSLAIPAPGGSALSTPLKLTISIGVAQIQEHEDALDKVIHRADLALYRAKNGGRNRVEICPGTPG